MLVKDIARNTFDSNPRYKVNIGTTLYFIASDGAGTHSLWKSDGTAAGTARVKQFNQDAFLANPPLASVDQLLYFAVRTEAEGVELWKSDGTEAGTVLVKDIRPGSASSQVTYLTNVDGTLYFHATDGVSGVELWKSDGTEAGTLQVKDIFPGNYDSYPRRLTNVNGTLYFFAYDSLNGMRLWKSDGTETGTVGIKAVPDSLQGALTEVCGNVYFFTNWGNALWTSNGTEAGTLLVKDFTPGSIFGYQINLINVAGTLFFTSNDGASGVELWKSNGTETGTVRVRDVRPGRFSSSPHSLTNVGGTLYFSARGGATVDQELWMSDSTEAGTIVVKDINPGSFGSFPGYLANIDGTLFFAANDGLSGAQLWKSNGSAAGTVPVRLPGNLALQNPTSMLVVGNRMYVGGSRPEIGAELFSLLLFSSGDYDRNGVVNTADRTFWAANFGATSGIGLQADGNSNGVVDVADYTLWRDTQPTAAIARSAVSTAPVLLLPELKVQAITSRFDITGARIAFSPPRRSELLLLAQQPPPRTESATIGPVERALTGKVESAPRDLASLDAAFAGARRIIVATGVVDCAEAVVSIARVSNWPTKD